jgi:hypothetical protein
MFSSPVSQSTNGGDIFVVSEVIQKYKFEPVEKLMEQPKSKEE